MWSRVEFPGLNGWIEILCLAIIFYYLFFFLKGTRGAPVLTGLVLLFIGLIVLTRLIHLDALNWLLGRFSVYLAVALLIIFQPEIRRALAELGKQHLFGNAFSNETMVDQIVQATGYLALRKIGALIAIEQAIGMRQVQETGIKLDSAVTPELLAGIFSPYAPLHDGGVIIAGNRIVAARCMFPLSEQDELGKALGTRHRAAVGLSDETDAVVIVVSEETGVISVSHDGRLIQNLDENHLRRFLSGLLLHARRTDHRRTRLKRHAQQVLLWVRHRLWRGDKRE
ncbi:MAG: diadenylate cyclase CdaA [Verrucomicrobia bacterium]|nr:diadenylate cyclase CdaA [Verrucomicrobiota bacterium]MBU1734128.1 diadenylate cyclase CdaA [Verrucomicrobiota bacterium]MBU1857086.1 diadenylate cyclase CdaA [Verrucomicrobiota bacterium]